ncbi:MAG: hypothetical protein R6V28_00705 [Nitriliruptoraceae bacterium]
MPPKRCPECGRFLSNELVASLASSSVPCPRCDTPLSADSVVGGARGGQRSQPSATAAAVGSAAVVEVEEQPASEAASVRPPDLDPSEVQTVDDDVLAGWDVDVTADEIASWRFDRRPFPIDTVVVAVGAVLGGVLGSAVSERRRAVGAGVGVLGGVVAAGTARRVWELRP